MHANWGRSIDVIELSRSTNMRNGKPRIWEIYTKQGGGMLGSVRWDGRSRQYIFSPSSLLIQLSTATLYAIGNFVELYTQSYLEGKVKAAG